jgi:signal transduction histidine kinase
MGRHFRLPMAVIAGALLGLIALLATLQYKWLGQISGAERDRMKASLNTRAGEFAQDVDRELTRAFLLFQIDPMPSDEGPVAGLVARYDRWQATARFPRLLKDVYLATPKDGAATLQRLNAATRFLEPADWPASLAGVRSAMEQATPVQPLLPSQAPASFVVRPQISTVWPAVPALVVSSPMLMVTHRPESLPHATATTMTSDVRYTILLLDADYVRNEMLPGLAQRHFQGPGDGFDYQLAVVPTAAGQPAIYRSVADFSPAPDAPADARVDLFQVRVKDFDSLVTEVARFTTLFAVPRDGTQHSQTTFVRQEIKSPQGNVTFRTTAPLSIVVQTDQRGVSSTVQQRIGTIMTGAAAAMNARAATASGQWRLLVKHPSGSLERAVNAARTRNLLISSTILGILGVSVGFLVLSTRRAHALARQQLEFVATVSHELRTPLAVIRSAADNLADGVVHDEARIRQYGELVRREGLRLTDLVEQILEFAGLQSGQRAMTPQPVEIGMLLREVIAAAGASAPAAFQIEVSVAEDLPAVAGDDAALRRVFQNLIGNAIKYGGPARWIGVTASATTSTVDVSVTDRGIGIAPADQEKIFDPFYRAPDVVAAQIQGAGLGLSLVKRIVEAHAGRIVLTSTPGQGSTFTVSLPVMAGDLAERRDSVAQAAAQPL